MSQSSWTWDSERRQWFYWDGSRGRVYENDVQLANQARRRDDPRSLPQQMPASSVQGNPTSCYTPGLATYTVRPPQQQRQQQQQRRRHRPQTSHTRQPYQADNIGGSLPSSQVSPSPGGGLVAGFHPMNITNFQPFQQQTHQIHSPPPGHSRLLRAEFKRKQSKFFQEGKVFLVLWTEGTQVDREEVMSGAAWTRNSYDEWVYTKVRRFIVVRPGVKSCVAVPITTNNGQGAAKEGERKSDYCMVYSGKTVPDLGPGEAPAYSGEAAMQPQPIRVDTDPGENLDPMSRINLAQPQTIQHYFKVKSVGKVNRNSMAGLTYQFRHVIGMIAGGQNSLRTVSPQSEADLFLRAISAKGYTPEQVIELLSRYQTKKARDGEVSKADGSEEADDDCDEDEDENEETEPRRRRDESSDEYEATQTENDRKSVAAGPSRRT